MISYVCTYNPRRTQVSRRPSVNGVRILCHVKIVTSQQCSSESPTRFRYPMLHNGSVLGPFPIRISLSLSFPLPPLLLLSSFPSLPSPLSHSLSKQTDKQEQPKPRQPHFCYMRILITREDISRYINIISFFLPFSFFFLLCIHLFIFLFIGPRCEQRTSWNNIVCGRKRLPRTQPGRSVYYRVQTQGTITHVILAFYPTR